MESPQLWLNGRQLTGRAHDRAPVLCPVELTWGTDSPLNQPAPANLKFTVLFLDGMDDVPDLSSGAKIELVHADQHRTIFAGQIRTMSARASELVKGALEVTANATDYTADLDSEYISTNWNEANNRRQTLTNVFADAGWTLTVPYSPQPRAQAKYNSIKLLTMLDRFAANFRGRRYDTSYRNTDGEVVRKLTVMEGTSRFIPADTLQVQPDGTWWRSFNSPLIGTRVSPIVALPARNVLLDPEWTQDPGNTITGVQLSVMIPGDDGFTTQTERNFKAPAATVAKYGLRSVDVESDLLNSADQAACAAAWMNDDSPWQMSELKIRSSSELANVTLRQLLDQNYRYGVLLTISGVLPNRPDPGPTVLRSYVIGGSYVWTGKTWELSLALERTIYAKPAALVTYTDLRNAVDPRISTATFTQIGERLTYGDFKEIVISQA